MVDFMTPLFLCLGLEGSAQWLVSLKRGLPVKHCHRSLGAAERPAAAQRGRTFGDSRPSKRLGYIGPSFFDTYLQA